MRPAQRLVFSGDQHIGARHLLTYEQQAAALSALVDETLRLGPAALVLCGDATHFARPDPEVMRIWGEQLRRLEGKVRIVAIAGNHDGAAVTRVFEHFRGAIDVAVEPRIVTIATPAGELDIACLPWLPDSFVRAAAAGGGGRQETARLLTAAATDILRGFTAQRRPGVPMVLATHATIAGATTSSAFNLGYQSGDHYILPLEELADFDFVGAGHVHLHQTLGLNGVYTGSLQPLDFSEEEPKGFVVAEVQSGAANWRFVPVPTPRPFTLDLTGRDEIEAVFGEAVLAGSAGATLMYGALVRVRVHCDEATAREFPPARISAAPYAAGARLVQVELDVAREDRARDAGMTSEIGVMAAMSRHLADAYPDEEQATRLERAAAVAYAEVHTRAEWAGGTLRLRAIECTDFLGVESARLELAPGDRIVALTAPVGTGKSAVGSDSIRAALFGTSRAGARASDALIRNGSDTARAAVEIEDATGRAFRIVRTFKRESRGRVATQLDVLEAMP